MVTAANNVVLMTRQLDWQDIDSPLSRVWPVSLPVDPMRRYWFGRQAFSARTPQLAARLQSASQLFEWAYGYRDPAHKGQRLTRRAPSAGALYPTELLFVTHADQEWLVLYYHFASHAFYRVPVQRPEAVANALGLSEVQEATLLLSVLWRTVQRYGVRGYRYCLLDAAHVGSNLVHAARACGRDLRVSSGMLTEQLEDAIDLGRGEGLTAVLVSGPPGNDRPIPAPAIASGPGHVSSGREECPPMLSPVLNRVIAFHKSTLYDWPEFELETQNRAENTLEGLHFWERERYSAKDFTGGEISCELYAAMIRIATMAPLVQFGRSACLTAHAIRLNVSGLSSGCETLTDSATGAPKLSQIDSKETATQLWRACQKQNIMRSCAFAIVLGTHASELAVGDPRNYRRAVLNAGSVTAELYRAAARWSLGTTSIGGFSDPAISKLIGEPDVYPIVIQAFGVPMQNAAKLDAIHSVEPTFKSARAAQPIGGLLQ